MSGFLERFGLLRIFENVWMITQPSSKVGVPAVSLVKAPHENQMASVLDRLLGRFTCIFNV